MSVGQAKLEGGLGEIMQGARMLLIVVRLAMRGVESGLRILVRDETVNDEVLDSVSSGGRK